jgi:geranylgeranyl pyrophosphate synthase
LHKVFGEALAVLAGDALLTHAFALLARAGPLAPDLVAVLADAAGSRGMVGGQDLDLAGTADERPAGVPGAARLVTDSARPAHPAAPPAGQSLAQTVARIHELKTARLFGAAAEMGAICARARPAERAAARGFGLALGRSFQAVDDVLDVTGDAASLGKTPGKDERAGKLTLVAALGLEGARAEARRLGGEARAAAAALGLAPGDLGSDLVDHLLGRRA